MGGRLIVPTWKFHGTCFPFQCVPFRIQAQWNILTLLNDECRLSGDGDAGFAIGTRLQKTHSRLLYQLTDPTEAKRRKVYPLSVRRSQRTRFIKS